MPRLAARSLAVLALALVLPSAASAQDPAGATHLQRLLVASRPVDLFARDGRLGFGGDCAERARTALDAGAASTRDRAAALFALGAARSIVDRARVESHATAGPREERLAALLALGELGGASVPLLERVAASADDEPAAASCALLALALTGESAGASALAAAVERGHASPDTAAAFRRYADARLVEGVARGALAADDGPPPPALALLLDLRWRAARAHGTVDGRRWRGLLTEALLSDDEFLDRVVLEASTALEGPGRDDHVLEILATGTGHARVRAAAASMPDALATLMAEGRWRPAGPREWSALLETIDEERLERRFVPMLEASMLDPATAYRSGLLLLRAGALSHEGLVRAEMAAANPGKRVAIARAFGISRDEDRIPELLRLRDDPDVNVRAAALVSLVRLGHGPSKDGLRVLLASGPSNDRAETIAALADEGRRRDAGVLAAWLEAAYAERDLTPRETFALEIALARQGRLETRERLRAYLGRGDQGPLLPLVVQALSVDADERDVALLRARFPVDDDLELNVEIALGLLRAGDPLADEVLRTAMWREPWNRSVLAAGLFAKRHGVRALMAEVRTPPTGVSERDVRRVGFAIGEWGGLQALEELGRRLNAGDAALQGAYLGALSTRTH